MKWKTLLTEEWMPCYIGLTAWALITLVAAVAPISALQGVWLTPPQWSTLQNLGAWLLAPISVVGVLCVGGFIVGSLTLARHVSAKVQGEDAEAKTLRTYSFGLVVVFTLATCCAILGTWSGFYTFGLDCTVWSLLCGIVIANLLGDRLPPFLRMVSLKAEFFIKCGLVLMAVHFQSLLRLGLPGIVVSWPVTLVVLSFTWIVSRLPFFRPVAPHLSMCMSCGVAVCGNSACIAVSPVVKASKSDMTLIVSILTLGNIPMMILLPRFCKLVHMSEQVAGAWFGGSLDATWAVLVASQSISFPCLQVASLVKMIQNSLIGFITAAVFVYWVWTGRDEKPNGTDATEEDPLISKHRVHISIRQLLQKLWVGFPKFLLGFLIISLLVSYVEPPVLMFNDYLVVWAINSVKLMSSWFFLCAFVAIGLSCDISKMVSQLKSGRLVLLYLIGSTFDYLLTFVVAYLMFSGMFASAPTLVP
ncbi:sac3 ganp domain protein [Pelomyxa schiedti]|nr:sac3 ganp domain protein [Pelomyxa schiedti]